MNLWRISKENPLLRAGPFLALLFALLFTTSFFPALYHFSGEGARVSHLVVRSVLIAITPILLLPVIYWTSVRRPIFNSWKNILLHLVLSVIFSFLFLLIFQLLILFFMDGVFFLGMKYAAIESILVRQFFTIGSILFFTYWGLVVLLGVKNYYEELGKIERKSNELKSQLELATLSSLRAQLKPHFLFNTLSMVDQMITTDPDTAVKMVDKLEMLLRTTYDRTGSESCTLREEINFIKKYLAIETHRFRDRLTVSYAIAPDVEQVQVPRYLLQPLVENALVHGVSKTIDSCRIFIQAESIEGFLRITIQDNGPGIRRRVKKSRKGIGLKNVRARLRLYYGKEVLLKLVSLKSGGVRSEILVPEQYWKSKVA